MWDKLWEFRTANFTVQLACTPEDSPDTSWMDADDLAKLDSGEWVNVTFRVRVLLDGNEVGADYLGNSVYSDVEEFRREHLGIRPKSRAAGVNYGCYFPDMLARAIEEARNNVARLQSVKLRNVA